MGVSGSVSHSQESGSVRPSQESGSVSHSLGGPCDSLQCDQTWRDIQAGTVAVCFAVVSQHTRLSRTTRFPFQSEPVANRLQRNRE